MVQGRLLDLSMRKGRVCCFIKIVINHIKATLFLQEMKSHIFRHQTFITVSLFTLLVFLIAFQIAMPERDLDGQFSLIAGWLGIVIGFFFNQQIAEFFQKKYLKTEEQKRRLSEETEKAIKEFLETDEKRREKYEKLQKIKEPQNKK